MTDVQAERGQHTDTEIYDALTRADVAAVATHEGVRIKQRQMHFAVDEKLNLYFATMKGDPKTVQIINDPKVSLLILDRSGDMGGWSETELSGTMEIITDPETQKRAASMLYHRSPIVKNLMDHAQDHILEWIAFKPHGLKFRIFGEIVQGFPPTVRVYHEHAFSFMSDLRALMKQAHIWMMATRAQFLTATILPILLGIAIAYTATGTLSLPLALLTILGGCLLHLGANLLNDYFDHLGGSDAANVDYTRPFSGGSRVIQLGLIPPTAILTSASIATLGGLLIGAYLAYVSGPALITLGLVGLLILVLYSLPRFGLASLGLGELAIGLVFGPFMTLGAFMVQTGYVDMLPVLASLPLALMITLILFVNEFPDMKADRSVGKNTLVVRMGLSLSSGVYLILGVLTLISTVVLIKLGMLPLTSILGVCGVAFVVWGWQNATKHLHEPKSLTPTCAATVSAHLLVGSSLVLAYATTTLDETLRWGISSASIVLLSGYLALLIQKKKGAFEQAKHTFAQ